MPGLPWTKFQDFYLRLGFLKVLVAALSPERRSATNEMIVRRLQTPLFDSTSAHRALRGRVSDFFTDIYPRKTSSGKTIDSPEVAEALLAMDGSESALYGITKDTAYKILDWGHDVRLVGRANQITERGLILRALGEPARAEQFFSGQIFEWRPLILTLRERLFFLYQLEEIDSLTSELIKDLGSIAPGRVLETRDASRLTLVALLRVLERAEPTLGARDIGTFRTAQELALTIAAELDEKVPERWISVARSLAIARGAKPRTRAKDAGSKIRKTTKNADHQTIPRFEQLIDMGFLTKPGAAQGASPREEFSARRRWRYVPTPLCGRWARARGTFSLEKPFAWYGFAATATASFHDQMPNALERPSPRLVAERLWAAYSTVRRSVGLTPLDSVALVAMIDSVVDGRPVEMADVHELLTRIRERGILTDCVHFASGSALDKMFIQLKPNFPVRFTEEAAKLADGVADG